MKHLFSFKGRLDRAQFAKIGIPTAIGIIVISSVVETNGEPNKFLLLVHFVGNIIYASASCRRPRDGEINSTKAEEKKKIQILVIRIHKV